MKFKELLLGLALMFVFAISMIAQAITENVPNSGIGYLVSQNWPMIATVILTILSTLLGAKFRKWKNIAVTIAEAIKDNKITLVEEKKIVESFKELNK